MSQQTPDSKWVVHGPPVSMISGIPQTSGSRGFTVAPGDPGPATRDNGPTGKRVPKTPPDDALGLQPVAKAPSPAGGLPGLADPGSAGASNTDHVMAVQQGIVDATTGLHYFVFLACLFVCFFLSCFVFIFSKSHRKAIAKMAMAKHFTYSIIQHEPIFPIDS